MRLSALLLATLLLANCKSSKPPVVEANPVAAPRTGRVLTDRTLQPTEGITILRIEPVASRPKAFDITFTGVGICDGDEVHFVSSGVSTRSIPPQMPVYLHHVVGTKACPDARPQTRRYDLSPLASPAMGTIFRLKGYEQPIVIEKDKSKNTP